MNWIRGQSLTLALLVAIALAWAFPTLGASQGPLRTEFTTKLAVAVIFLMQGLSLHTRQLLRSARNLPLFSFCLAANFLLAPALMLGLLFASGDLVPTSLRDGLLYLSVLPTTISSAIVLTGNCHGDSAGALFASTLSNILGVFITPILCIQFLDTFDSSQIALTPVLQKLALLVLLPLALGQLIRPLARHAIDRLSEPFKRISAALVVFIVFAALCNSVQDEVWTQVGPAYTATAFGTTLIFLLLISATTWFTAPLATRAPDQRIAAFFCGSQKTLAAGAPMAAILFANTASNIGLVLLPLIIFHPLQLAFSAAISPALIRFNELKGNQPPRS